MKLIDLFIKIANGEKVPDIIKFQGKIFKTNGKEHNYYCEKEAIILEEFFIFEELNDEVEIIEDTPKKIEQIGKSYDIRNYKPKDDTFTYDMEKLIDMIQDIYDKQSEIIDRLNGEENEL